MTPELEHIRGPWVALGAAVSDGAGHRLPPGARCPMVAILDFARLSELDRIERYRIGEDGLDIGWLLADALAPHGWTDVTVRCAAPADVALEGIDDDLAILEALAGAAEEGVAMVAYGSMAQATVVN
jgi:hypothetical protein